MLGMKRILTCLLLLLVLAGCGSAHDGDHADPDGDGCTIAHPCKPVTFTDSAFDD
jgi:hypothetical protein